MPATAHARRSRNGHAPRTRSRSSAHPSPLQTALKSWGTSFLVKLLLRKSVLIAIGLGTVVSWYIKRRFFTA